MNNVPYPSIYIPNILSLNKQKELVSQKDYSKKEFEANKKQIVFC